MTGDPRKSRLVVRMWIPIAVFAASLLALTVLQYVMPPNADSYYGLNHEGIQLFQEKIVGHDSPSIALRTYTLSFRLLLGIAWISYALAVILGLRGTTPAPKMIIGLVSFLAVSLAVLWPASLSCDSFAYVAYARMKVLYGQNPYACSPEFLRTMGDPTYGFIPWKMFSSYGSVWTALTIGTVALLKNAGLWWQVVAMKLIEALALIGAALAGRRIAGHLSPGKENLALLAIGLNPVLLIEGPGNGHNDMLMTCFLLIAISIFLGRRWLLGGLWLGLSIGTKFVTIAALPWVVMEYLHSKGDRNKALMSLALVILALVPTILCYLPFAGHGSPLVGLFQRWVWGSHVPSAGSGIEETWMHVGMEAVVRSAVRQLPLAIIFAGLTFWLWRERKPGKWLAAWVSFSISLILLTSGIWFPWYFIWPWAISLCCWDRLHIRLSSVCLVVTFLLSFMYSVVLR